MDRLEETLLSEPNSSNRRKIFVLHGMGGIGKTQLAVEFARKNQYRFTAVFWLNGASEDQLKQYVLRTARRIPENELAAGAGNQLNALDCSLDFASKVFKDWLSSSSNQQWLLIFDNVDRDCQSRVVDPLAYDLRRHIPDCDHGSILVTSRIPNLAQDLGSGFKVDRLNDEQALAILEARAGKKLSGKSELHYLSIHELFLVSSQNIRFVWLVPLQIRFIAWLCSAHSGAAAKLILHMQAHSHSYGSWADCHWLWHKPDPI